MTTTKTIDSYSEILEIQENLKERLEKDTKNLTDNLLLSFSKLKTTMKRENYDRIVSSIEIGRDGCRRGIEFIDDNLPQIIENANQNKQKLMNIIEKIDEFMIEFNKTKIGNLEELLRDEIKKMPKEKMDKLPSNIQTVIYETFGGSKRKTRRTRKIKKKIKNLDIFFV